MPAKRNGASLLVRPANQAAVPGQQEVAGACIAQRRCHRMQQQQPVHPPVVPGGGEVLEASAAGRLARGRRR